ncbi:MAG: glycosyltransferase [Chloroflexi bacterium]|nr:glycosyltransferase [Chloroflexota bacterium]
MPASDASLPIGASTGILIVTASTGAGHNSAAMSLCRALTELAGGGGEVSTVDLLARASWLCQPWRLYGPIILRWPSLWGLVYGLSNNSYFFRLSNGLGGGMRDLPLGLLDARRTQCIVCVHPLGNQAVAHALSRLEHPAPLITVVTDLGEAHTAWIAPQVSLYVAPTEEVRASLVAKGVSPERVTVLGLPTDRRFCADCTDPCLARRKLGLAEDRFTVLLTGGGEGAGDILAAAKAISHAKLPIQLVIVCGRNEGLRRRLEKSGLAAPRVVLGFTDNMSDVMQAADVVVGKAGALTIGEAVAMGKPLVILSPLPGQEDGNARFAADHGLAVRVSDVSELVSTLERWMSRPEEMAELAARAAPYRRRWAQAAEQIAAAILAEAKTTMRGGQSCLQRQ